MANRKKAAKTKKAAMGKKAAKTKKVAVGKKKVKNPVIGQDL
jgi:hypothetical protein